MTRTTLTIILSFVCVLIHAQTPESMTYQAVVRDNAGNQLANQSVTIEFAIREDSPTGSVVFEEYHDLIPTNQFGLFTAMIGAGILTGNGTINQLSLIPWGQHTYFLEVRATIPGQGSTEIIGVSQLLTVPYSYYASRAGSVENETDGDVSNELIEDFSLEGNILTITENGIEHSIDLSTIVSSNGDQDSTNELITNVSIDDQFVLHFFEGSNEVSVDLNDLIHSTWSENTEGVYNDTDYIGIGTPDPNSTLEIEGSLGYGLTMLNGEDYNLNDNASNEETVVFICDVSTQDVTIHLVPASQCPGRMYKFRKMFTGSMTSNDVNIVAVDGEYVDGLSIYEMTNIYAEYAAIISNGSNWFVIEHSKD